MKRYFVYGVDKSYRYLWLACFIAGVIAAKNRWKINGVIKSGCIADNTDSTMRNDWNEAMRTTTGRPKGAD